MNSARLQNIVTVFIIRQGQIDLSFDFSSIKDIRTFVDKYVGLYEFNQEMKSIK